MALATIVLLLTLAPTVLDAAVCTCGGEVDGSSPGEVTSPDYGSGNYPNNRDCEYVIESPQGTVISLQFSEMDVEVNGNACSFDFVSVHDGDSKASTSLGRFCGNQVPSTVFTSGGNHLTIRFKSDPSNTANFAGWKANFSSETGGCGAIWQGDSGTFKSPGFPVSYENNMRCGQTFVVGDGQAVEVTFENFDIEDHDECAYDKLVLHDGPDASSPVLLEKCGSSIPGPVTSTGKHLYMYLKTDSSVTKPGVSGTFRAVTPPTTPPPTTPTTTPTTTTQPPVTDDGCETEPPVQTQTPATPSQAPETTPTLPTAPPATSPTSAPATCGPTHFNASVGGLVKSPGHPNLYPNSMECTYTFTAAAGKAVKIHFFAFDVEDNRKCQYDAVEFYDNGNTIFTEDLCGATIPVDVVSPSNVLVMKFRSDSSVTKTGFGAIFSEVDPVVAPTSGGLPECGTTLYDEPSVVGGNDTVIQKHPWQVWYMRCTNGACYSCGGSIVAKNWVLTAAHCTNGAQNATDFTVYAGSTKGGANRNQVFRGKRWFDHPDFSNVYYDVSLIEIDGEFDLSSALTRSVCLAETSDNATFDGQRCVVTGWGATEENGGGPSVLQEATVTVADRDECNRVGNRPSVSETHLCAGHLPGGIDTCQGDSGGPLVCDRADGNKVLAGITSFGEGCARPDTYGYYTRVSHFRQWIDETMAL